MLHLPKSITKCCDFFCIFAAFSIPPLTTLETNHQQHSMLNMNTLNQQFCRKLTCSVLVMDFIFTVLKTIFYVLLFLQNTTDT